MSADQDAETAVVVGQWDRDALMVHGADAVDYLQGQVSADVAALAIGQSCLGLLLAPNGKMEALLRLWRTDENRIVIDTDSGAGSLVQGRLQRFLLRTKVEIEALNWESWVIRGDGAGALEAESALDNTGAELVGLGLWPGIAGVDLLGSTVTPPPGIPAVDSNALEVMRIRCGFPKQDAEITSSTIPAEIGPWLITAAVSFSKGCYVGQELTARMHNRVGTAPRQLHSLSFPAETQLCVGDPLFEPADPTKSRAEVTSTAIDENTGEVVALAFVHRSVSEPDTLLPS